MSIAATLGYISGDSHVNEPRNLWRDNLPKSLGAMSGIAAGEDGGWDLVLAESMIPAEMDPEYEERRMMYADPEHRYGIMREEGILGECVYPTIGLYVWVLTDADAGAASCRVYNEWVADRLARSPRFKCAGLVPTWRVEDAVAEVGRHRRLQPRADHDPGGRSPEWNHCSGSRCGPRSPSRGSLAVIHQGTGHAMYFYRGQGAGVANLFATQIDGAALRGAPRHLRRVGTSIPTSTWCSSSTTSAGWRGRCRRSTTTTSRSPVPAHRRRHGGSTRTSPSLRASTCAARSTRRSRTTRSPSPTSRSPAPKR